MAEEEFPVGDDCPGGAGVFDVQIIHAVLKAVVGEFDAVAAEGAGEDDVGPGGAVVAVDGLDDVGVFADPQFGRGSGGEAALEEFGACGAVEEEGALGENCVEVGAVHAYSSFAVSEKTIAITSFSKSSGNLSTTRNVRRRKSSALICSQSMTPVVSVLPSK